MFESLAVASIFFFSYFKLKQLNEHRLGVVIPYFLPGFACTAYCVHTSLDNMRLSSRC